MLIIIGNDRLRMAGIILINMSDCFFYRGNYLQGKNIIQVFSAPILLCGVYSSGNQLTGCFICPDLHMFLLQASGQDRKKLIFYFLMDQHRLTGIAYTHTLSLGIHNNICSHLQIGSLIHISMAVTCTGLDHRDRTILNHCLDQSSAASGDQHIHILIHFHKFCCGFSGGVRDQLDGILCDSLLP